jgi:hypothetical protein
VTCGVGARNIGRRANRRIAICCANVLARLSRRKNRYWAGIDQRGIGEYIVCSVGSASIRDHVRYTSNSVRSIPSRVIAGSKRGFWFCGELVDVPEDRGALYEVPKRLIKRCL